MSFSLLPSKMDLEELENGNEPKLPEFKLGMNVIPSLTSNFQPSPFVRYVNRQADKFWNNSRQSKTVTMVVPLCL